MPPEHRIPPGQHLLIDADDTLWENNVYFERAIANFISFLNHHEYTPDQVRQVLYDVERENIRAHGYGLHSFALALVRCFEHLSVEPLTPALHETIRGFAYAIAEHPMEILPEVPETLADLAQRHHLLLLTKGNVIEQSGKVERSGLKQHFAAIEVVVEKDAASYNAVVEKYGLPRQSTWMIGNSPSPTSILRWKPDCTRSLFLTAIPGCWSATNCVPRPAMAACCRWRASAICAIIFERQE